MLVYKKDVEESFTIPEEQDEKKILPSDGTIQGNTSGGSMPPPPSSLGIQSTPVVQPPAPMNVQQGQPQMVQQPIGQQPMVQQPMVQQPMVQQPMVQQPQFQ